MHAFSVESIKPYWDITEAEIFDRVKFSLVPTHGGFFERVENKPDIYGPFWILTTLIFIISVAGNLALWIGSNGKVYDFNFVPLAASLVYMVGFIIPLIL